MSARSRRKTPWRPVYRPGGLAFTLPKVLLNTRHAPRWSSAALKPARAAATLALDDDVALSGAVDKAHNLAELPPAANGLLQLGYG